MERVERRNIEGQKTPPNLDFSRVPDPNTLTSQELKELFRSPFEDTHLDGKSDGQITPIDSVSFDRPLMPSTTVSDIEKPTVLSNIDRKNLRSGFRRKKGPNLTTAESEPRPLTGRERTVNRLSPRQLQILERIAASQSNQTIADSLGLSVSTIKSHVAHIFGKLGVRKRRQAAAIDQSLFKP